MKRRGVIVSAGSTLFGGCFGGFSGDTTAERGGYGEEPLHGQTLTDWPQPRFDARNSAFLEEGGIEAGPEVRWNVDWSVEDVGFLGPSLVVDGVAVVVNYRERNVVGLDLETFEAAWTRAIESPHHTLEYSTAAEDSVFVTAGPRLYRLSLADGEPKWKTTVHSSQTPPVYSDGLVFAAQESGTGRVTAIDAETGDTTWSVDTAMVSPCRPACTDESVVTIDLNGRVTSFDVADGGERWSTETGISPSGPPVIGSNVLIGGTRDDRGVVESIDPADGTRTGTAYFDDPIAYALAYAEGSVYAVDRTGVLHCLDDRTHSQWEYNPDRDFRPEAHADRSPIVVGDSVYYYGPDLDVHAVGAGHGEPLWTVDFEPISPPPLVSAGSALLLTHENGLRIVA